MSLQKLSIAVLLAASAAATTAHARDGEKPYLGLDYSLVTSEIDLRIDFTETGFPSESISGTAESEPYGITVRAGTVVAKYLAVEAHAAFGVHGDSALKISGDFTTSSFDVNVRSELDAYYGVFLRPQISLGPIDLYGLAGYGFSKMRFKAEGLTTAEDTSGFSYGAGVQVNLGADWALNASYILLSKKEDITLISNPIALADGTIDQARADLTVESMNVGVVYRF